MDVEPLHAMPHPRRTLRRPVAGGIPAPQLEGWLDAIEEDEWAVPNFVWFVGAGVVTSLALAAGGFALLAYWFDKTFGALTGR